MSDFNKPEYQTQITELPYFAIPIIPNTLSNGDKIYPGCFFVVSQSGRAGLTIWTNDKREDRSRITYAFKSNNSFITFLEAARTVYSGQIVNDKTIMMVWCFTNSFKGKIKLDKPIKTHYIILEKNSEGCFMIFGEGSPEHSKFEAKCNFTIHPFDGLIVNNSNGEFVSSKSMSQVGSLATIEYMKNFYLSRISLFTSKQAMALKEEARERSEANKKKFTKGNTVKSKHTTVIEDDSEESNYDEDDDIPF